MRNKVILFLTAVVCFFLQCTVIQVIAIGSITPNLLLIFVTSVGLMRGKKTALFTGFWTGLLADIFYGRTLGVYAFLYMVIGYLSGFTCKIYYDNNIKVPMTLAAIGDLLYNMGIYIFLFLLKGNVQLGYFLRRIMIPELIYTIFFTAIVYRLFYLINHKFMQQERKEGNSTWLLK